MATLRRSVEALSRRDMARIGVAAEVFYSLGYVADNSTTAEEEFFPGYVRSSCSEHALLV